MPTCSLTMLADSNSLLARVRAELVISWYCLRASASSLKFVLRISSSVANASSRACSVVFSSLPSPATS